MTRTRSQDIKNNNLKVPSKKGTTVESTSRPTVVSVGTLTEGLWGSGGCCHVPGDNVESDSDVDLRSIVNILCDRISDLEKEIRKQFVLIANLTRHSLRVDVGVQAEIENRDLSRTTYAEVVKSTLLIQNDTKSDSERSVGAQNISVEPSDSKYTGKKYRKQKWKGNEKCDVKFHMSSTAQNKNDVNRKKKEYGTESKETKRQPDLPLVAILHDSVLNGVQGKRLGRSYGFDVFKQRNEKTDDIDKSLESVDGPVKAIVAHCGINDIRTKDPKDVSKKMVKSLKGILKDRPNLKDIVSKIPPVKDSNLQAKRELFNALVFSELVEDPNISFVAHENLHFTSLKDTIHPNMKGSSIIARNLGRHIHNLFCERPWKIARRDLLQPYKLHSQQCRDSFGWQSYRQPWLRW